MSTSLLYLYLKSCLQIATGHSKPISNHSITCKFIFQYSVEVINILFWRKSCDLLKRSFSENRKRAPTHSSNLKNELTLYVRYLYSVLTTCNDTWQQNFWVLKKPQKRWISAVFLKLFGLIISLRTVEHDELPLNLAARVFELFSLDTPGFSGFLPLSYPVCGP